MNDLGDHAAERLDAERKRRDVEEQHVFRRFGAARENISLHGGAERDHLVRVELRVRLAVEEFLHDLAKARNARGAAHQRDLVDLLGREACVAQRLLARPDSALQDGLDQAFELLARDLALILLALRQIDFDDRALLRGERDLGVDHGLAHGLYDFGIAAEIQPHVAADIIERDGDEQVVDVVAAEMGVTVGGDDFEDALVEAEDRDIEGTAAEVVDGNDAVALLVEAVRERSRGGLVDKAQNFESGDAAGVFSGLALRIVE